MSKNAISIVDVDGGLVTQVEPPFQPDLVAGQIITLKGRNYTVQAIPGDLSVGGFTMFVQAFKSAPLPAASPLEKRGFWQKVREFFDW